MVLADEIWNCRETMKTRTVNGAFLRYFKRSGTADELLRTRALNGAF